MFDVDGEVTHRILDIAVAQEDFDSTQIAIHSVDDRVLRTSNMLPPFRLLINTLKYLTF